MRVLHLPKRGSAFLLDGKNHDFLVTAQHVVNDLPQSGSLEILDNKLGKPFNAEYSKLIKGARAQFGATFLPDLAVLVMKNGVLGLSSFPLLQGNEIELGQEVFFLGYPLSFLDYGSTVLPTGEVRAPLLKRAVFSGAIHRDGVGMLLFDGFNNSGFSGGPIFVKGKDGKRGIFGIVSGYFHDTPRTVFPLRDSGSPDSRKVLSDQPVGAVVDLNSGFMLGFSFAEVKKLITRFEFETK